MRLNSYEAIMREQFELAYFGRVEYGASDRMSVSERHSMHYMLVDQKKAERKAQEEALRKSKESRSNKGWKRHK